MKVLVMTIKTSEPVAEGAGRLRGYIGDRFPEHSILHHHTSEGYIYTYPKVQYKVIGGTPVIVGIDEGADALKEISGSIETLRLGKKEYRVESVQMTDVRPQFGVQQENAEYAFISPWIALSAENYEKYRSCNNWRERKEMLNSVLVGNILSMAKGLGYVAEKRIYAHSLLDPVSVDYKGVRMLAFTGRFRVNFAIPDFFGIGKGVSQGFGCIKKSENMK